MTHGPWSLNIEDGRAEVCVDGERLTDPYIGDDDARLIAAAPELLDALKAILAHQPDHGDTIWQQVEDAIAKAEGRP